jgi:hypothetical protein
MDGGGSSGATNSTVTQSNIPEWLRPQVESLIGGATKELFNTKEVPGVDGAPSTFEIEGTKPYTPYSANPQDYVAGFSPLQQQVQANAANLQMPGQFNQATGYANAAGQGGMQSAQQALGYGNAGFQSGQTGQNIGTTGGAYYGGMGADYGAQGADYGAQGAAAGNLSSQIGQMGLQAQQTGQQIGNQAQNYAAQAAAAGQNYANQATNPAAYQQYMNPYMQNVVDVQNLAAQRNADIASTQRGANAARSGAFGGARQAIENAEANRALQSMMNANQATGLQNAYNQAQQNLQYGSNLGLQGLQGANQGLNTALSGGQLGLSGIGTALQGQQGAMQGAGLGIQGSQAGMQGAQIGLSGVDRQLAGTAQGMQGAGMGLQGVSGAQSGYGLANQAGANLANIGTQQLAGQTGILGLQNQIGGQQQAQEQAITNQAISNYAQGQNAPMERMNQYNALLRGYALPGTTTTQYQAQPTALNQIAGAGTALLAGNALMKAKGGRIHAPNRSGLHTLALRNVMRG